MEEHFILRVPQSVAERLERVLNEDPSCANDQSLDLSFQGAVFLIHFSIEGEFFCE
jgi:transcription initiation factor TFIID subunit 7